MKENIVKFIGILTAVLLLVSTLTACSAGRPIKGSEQELTPVGSVDGFDVLYEELEYVTVLYKEMLRAEYGDNIWDDPASAEKYRDELVGYVTDNITANYAILSLCRAVGITTETEEIQAATDKYVDELVAELGGRGEYKAALSEMGLTDSFFRFTIAVEYCRSELYYVYTQDLGIIEDDQEVIYDYIMDDNFVRTVHVFISNDEGDDVEANRRSAEQVVERIKGGESINTLIGSSYNEDFNLTTTHGYYFTRGEMLKTYEDAAFSLEIGQVSDVVETEQGFYVIQRLPLEPDYVLQNLVNLVSQYQYAELNRAIDEHQQTLTFEFNDYGKTIDLVTLE